MPSDWLKHPTADNEIKQPPKSFPNTYAFVQLLVPLLLEVHLEKHLRLGDGQRAVHRRAGRQQNAPRGQRHRARQLHLCASDRLATGRRGRAAVSAAAAAAAAAAAPGASRHALSLADGNAAPGRIIAAQLLVGDAVGTLLNKCSPAHTATAGDKRRRGL